MKTLGFILLLTISSGCMLIEFDLDASNWERFEGKVGAMHSLDEDMEIVFDYTYDAREKVYLSHLILAGTLLNSVDEYPRVMLKQGTKVCIDKIICRYEGGYKDYRAYGRAFQDGKVVEFFYYLGLAGYGDIEFPLMTPIPLTKKN